MRRLIALGLLAATPLAGQPLDPPGAGPAEVRLAFAVAYAAAAAGVPGADAFDGAALRSYVLYPYLQAARLERMIGRSGDALDAADEQVRQFLSAAGADPVGIGLRRAWLASLARRAQWRAFLDHYDPAAATVALECQRLNARIALGDVERLASGIVVRWLTPQQLPGECEPPFQWLAAQGELTEDLIAQRAALLLDSGQAAFARVIARRLPPDAAAPFFERADMIANPAAAIDAWLADPGREIDDSVLLEGWARLARNTPDAALTRFDPVATRASAPDQLSALALRLALGLAWDRRPEALEYFARVAPRDLDDPALEWFARAALWAGEWEIAGGAIEAMSTQKRSESAWRYWSARIAERRRERDSARAAYAALLADDNYYAAMAAARLGKRVEPRAETLPVDAERIEQIVRERAFVRARELQLVGLRNLATIEWRHGYAALAEALRPQTIHVAAEWEMHDIAVATATSHNIFNDYGLLYPRPFQNEIDAAVELTDVERSLLYGVLRQESLFRPDAASGAGALGVAQLMHDTARIAARRSALPAPRRADLFDAAVSIKLGAARLSHLLDDFDGQVPVALAAYNAGENAAKRWLPAEPIDSDIWIENIPYNETRAYVRRVLWHSLVVEWLETGRAQSARAWLDRVAAVSD